MSLATHPSRAFLPYPDAPVPNAANGPLRGLTFAVKDLFDVSGYPTGGGNPHVLARSGIKTTTAPTVQKLLDAGAAFVGKVHTDELAFSMNGQNHHYGGPYNGAAPDRITGARRRARRPQCRTSCATSRSAPTPVARSAHRPVIAVCSAYVRHMAGYR